MPTLFGTDLVLGPRCGQTEPNNSVNLYVRLTDACAFDCKFCEWSNKSTHIEFDGAKLIDSIHAIYDAGLTINKVSFTGGEPLLRKGILSMALFAIKQFDPTIFTVVSTTGWKYANDLPAFYIDSLALSRHHYTKAGIDESFNSRYKDMETVYDRIINEFPDKDKIHITCNMVRGLIDSPAEVYKFLNYYGELGIKDFGFVGLMPVNNYCKHKFIEPLGILADVPNTKITQCLVNKLAKPGLFSCYCNNYETVLENGEVVKSYARCVTATATDNRTLVFDINVLRRGFDGPVLY